MATFVVDAADVAKTSLRTWGAQVETDVADHETRVDALEASGGRLRNRIKNPTFSIDQRYAGVNTSIADNAYWADRWRYLGEASASCQARNGTYAGTTGHIYAGAITAPDTTSKFGAFQVMEGRDIRDLRSKSVTVEFTCSVSNASAGRLEDIRVAVLEFTGTEDAVSGDPITTWGSGGAGIFAYATNWAALNTPADLGVTTTAATYSVTVTVGASATNLGLLIWSDDKTVTAGDILYISNVKFSNAADVHDFEPRDDSFELLLCQRYFTKLGGDSQNDIIFGGYNLAGGGSYTTMALPTKMRALPTAAIVGTWTVSNCSQPTITKAGTTTISFVSVVTVSSAYNFQTENTTTYLTCSAEL